ncbi:MAG: hypothetical protein JO372_22005 [Solirubrobacterales bacterium]|nr:hypothetical protein [Solirubrobacterales bacterium]
MRFQRETKALVALWFDSGGEWDLGTETGNRQAHIRATSVLAAQLVARRLRGIE